MSRAKRIMGTAGLTFGSPLVLAFFLNNIAPSPVGSAKAACIERGWPEDQLELGGFQTSAKIIGSAGSVDFNVDNEDEAKVIRVTLQNPLYSLRWNVITCEEVQD